MAEKYVNCLVKGLDEISSRHPPKCISVSELIFCLAVFTNVYVIVCFRLIVHSVVVLPLVYLVCVRRNPFKIIRGVTPALLTAVLISSR